MTEIIPNEKLFEWYITATGAAKELNGSVTGIALASRTNSKYKNWVFKYKKYEETK